MRNNRLMVTVLFSLVAMLVGHARFAVAQDRPGFIIHVVGGHGPLPSMQQAVRVSQEAASPIFFTDESVRLKASLSNRAASGAKPFDLPVEGWYREISWRIARADGEPSEQQSLTATLIESAFEHDSLSGRASKSRPQDRILPGDLLAATFDVGRLPAGSYSLQAIVKVGDDRISSRPVKVVVKNGDEDEATRHLHLRARIDATKSMKDQVPLLLDLAKVESENPGPYESIASYSLRSGKLEEARHYYDLALERTVHYYEKNQVATVEAQQRREERLKYLKTVSLVYEYARAHDTLLLTPWTSPSGKAMFLWLDRKTGKPLGVVNVGDPGTPLPLPNETIGRILAPEN